MKRRKYVQARDYQLYGSGVNQTATTITLTTMTLPNSGDVLSMDDFGLLGYAVLEPDNNAKQETVSFTGIVVNPNLTVSLTGVTRGLLGVYPYTVDNDLRQSHAGGTIVRISNPAVFYGEFANKENDEDINGKWVFPSVAGSTRPTLNADTDSVLATELVTRGELNRTTSSPFLTPTVVSSSSATTGTSQATSLTWAHVSAGDNRLLTVQVSTQQDVTITGITYNGDALTQAESGTRVTGNLRTEIWYLVAPDLGTNNIVISTSGSAYISATALTLNSVDQTGPIGDSTSANGSSTTPSTVVTTTRVNSLVIDSLGTANNPITATAGAHQSIQQSVLSAATRQIATSIEVAPTAAATTMDYTISPTTNWSISAIEVLGSSAIVIGEDLDMHGFRIINLGNPVDPMDAVNLQTLQAAVIGGATAATTVAPGIVVVATQDDFDNGVDTEIIDMVEYYNMPTISQVRSVGSQLFTYGETIAARDYVFQADGSETIALAQNTSTGVVVIANSTTKRYGSIFTAGAAPVASLKAVSFAISAENSPTGTMTCDLYAVSGGVPTGSPIASSSANNVAVAGFGYFTFPTTPALVPGTQYALSLNFSGVTFGIGQIVGGVNNASTNGFVSTNSGSTWTGAQDTNAFIVYQGLTIGKVFKVDETNIKPCGPYKGFAKTSGVANDVKAIQMINVLDGFSGLTAGVNVYIDPSTPGAITQTASSGGRAVGIAVSSTAIQIAEMKTYGDKVSYSSGTPVLKDGILLASVLTGTGGGNPASFTVSETSSLSISATLLTVASGATVVTHGVSIPVRAGYSYNVDGVIIPLING